MNDEYYQAGPETLCEKILQKFRNDFDLHQNNTLGYAYLI